LFQLSDNECVRIELHDNKSIVIAYIKYLLRSSIKNHLNGLL